MEKRNGNILKMSAFIALFCLSLACFAYINSIDISSDQAVPPSSYVEEIEPQHPETLPDVEFVKRLVRKAFEFMTKSAFL